MTTGEQLKLDGMNAALAATTVGHHDHPNRIRTAIDELIELGQPFSADHVRDRLPTDTCAWMIDYPNVLPAQFGKYSQSGRIRQIGWCSPARKTRHGNVNRLWIRGNTNE